VLKAHIVSVCFNCFICFRGILQVFHMDVTKIDLDVAYVASVYSKYFIYFSRRMLQVCLSGCCICFAHVLHVSRLDVAYVLQWFFQVFLSVFYNCFKCIFEVFHLSSCMLHMSHLDVLKIDQILHMLQWTHLPQPPLTAA
jgi:hypothetical protein